MMTLKTNNPTLTFLDLHLFVGVRLDGDVEKSCSNRYLFDHFTSGGEYLKRVTHEGKIYLGKEVSLILTMQELERVEAHILSLLKRLVPTFNPEALEIFGY